MLTPEVQDHPSIAKKADGHVSPTIDELLSSISSTAREQPELPVFVRVGGKLVAVESLGIQMISATNARACIN